MLKAIWHNHKKEKERNCGSIPQQRGRTLRTVLSEVTQLHRMDASDSTPVRGPESPGPQRQRGAVVTGTARGRAAGVSRGEFPFGGMETIR